MLQDMEDFCGLDCVDLVSRNILYRRKPCALESKRLDLNQLSLVSCMTLRKSFSFFELQLPCL